MSVVVFDISESTTDSTPQKKSTIAEVDGVLFYCFWSLCWCFLVKKKAFCLVGTGKLQNIQSDLWSELWLCILHTGICVGSESVYFIFNEGSWWICTSGFTLILDKWLGFHWIYASIVVCLSQGAAVSAETIVVFSTCGVVAWNWNTYYLLLKSMEVLIWHKWSPAPFKAAVHPPTSLFISTLKDGEVFYQVAQEDLNKPHYWYVDMWDAFPHLSLYCDSILGILHAHLVDYQTAESWTGHVD